MATHDFRQIEWNEAIADDCRQLVRLAIREDLDRWHDWTTVALVPEGVAGRANVVAREHGTLAGMAAARVVLDEYDPRLAWRSLAADGETVEPGRVVAELAGPARSMLAVERPLLNLLGRLAGIATLARAYVDAVADTPAHVYDTRKTTPGWRRLEKYAVRCGGGRNHRLGLYDAVLIKDNHLALCAAAGQPVEGAAAQGSTAARAVARVREFLRDLERGDPRAGLIVEVEVDSLADLDEVLRAGPDIVLLDNLSPAELRRAVERRDAVNPQVQLEASGGIDLTTIAEVARSGVERISVGALTHSARWLDVALDWLVDRIDPNAPG